MESIIGQFICSKEHKGNRKNLLCLFKLQVVLMIFMSGSALKVSSQDAHFSQFYASPLTLNPAIAGTYTGTFRISAIYRDQWRSAVDDPLKTFAVSGDVKFNVFRS